MSTEEAEVVAPLDAYATAKPDEPTFTLQGGDPLAGPLVRTWAFLARRRAGLARFEQGSFSELIEAAIGNSVEHDEQEHNNLLVRATAAEQVSWSMDDYRRGNHHTDKPTEAADTHLNELQRIDLHDMKVRIAQKLSSFAGAMVEMAQELSDRGYQDEDTLEHMAQVSGFLRSLNETIEPRRIMKKGWPPNG
jgi:hypothetical protein